MGVRYNWLLIFQRLTIEQNEVFILHNARGFDARHVLYHAKAGVAEIDLTTLCYVRVNQQFCTLLGYDEADLLAGSGPSTMAYHADRPLHVHQWHHLVRSGEGFEGELRYVRVDGKPFWLHVSASVAAFGADGAPTHGFAIMRDIGATSRIKTELLAQRELLELALEIGKVGSFQRDYVNKVIYCSAKTREMHALPAGETPVPSDIWFHTVVPEDRARLVETVNEAFSARRPTLSVGYRFTHPVRGIRYIETRSRVTYDAAGVPLGSLGVVIDVTAQREAEQHLKHLAHHDALTALPNRALFQLRLAEALAAARAGQSFALLSLDLDAFKDINDTLGHPFGDRLLQEVAARLRAACQPDDVLARLGGDEFALIRAPLASPAQAVEFAAALMAAMTAPFLVDGHQVAVRASIGIVVAPEDGHGGDELLRHADIAMYHAKATGRRRYHRFQPAMAAQARARRALEADLEQAIAAGELELFYQPIVENGTQRVVAYEALIRWPHRTRGLVMPDEFIPVAETNGMILQICDFVLRRACTQAAAWPGGERVAVNVSATEFARPDLVAVVEAALAQSGLAPTRLEIEITERTVLHDNQDNIAKLHRLRALGIRIAIDDFGTGFSSLSYLQRFAFDTAKIDRSFIAQIEGSAKSLAIVQAVVQLCTALGVEALAEGVETEAQAAMLRDIGCGLAQGYYFGRPAPATAVPSAA
jgi:diguanylate cyclase (GGDEF)-like protein/PAS domain S-box-containing protein